jgi:hypothetical protein
LTEQVSDTLALAQGSDDMVGDVCPVAACMNEVRFCDGKYQAVQTFNHPLISCSSKAKDLSNRKVLDNGSDSSEGWAESFPPAYDGMGFIQNQEADGHLGKGIDESGQGKALCIGYQDSSFPVF